MISVDEALDRLFGLSVPLGAEEVPLTEANRRVLARAVEARRDQPPFAGSAMDGYALREAELATGAVFEVIGESAAGARFAGPVGAGQAVRIFTGAPMPEGADRVVIQEDVRREGDRITVTGDYGSGRNVRPAGGDFRTGDRVAAPRLLSPADVALLAAMNIPRVPVTRRPRVALIATGNELVQPGETPGPDQIVASNSYGLHALLTEAGAEVRLLPIARDRIDALETVFALTREGHAPADLIITIGGASVGDHDVVAQAAQGLGMEQSFYKVAMRPGKPLMAGRMGDAAMIGLPGNPVSAMVCGHVFVGPVIRHMLGLGAAPAPRRRAPLAVDVPANGPREHYLRARIGPDGIAPDDRQDSALLSVLSGAGALLVRAPHAPAARAGETVDYLPL
ncbi:molybdenum cofactor biosynthesis protein A [Pseudooceanicola batsensis HTCC2597]|uniref:Molybdopterin molybdenumtransferase n=1 Tax=Pseudooceanicola batsensis (strain ATCC BAA-863 / DSM 15984 / KCTC 12145 / HTCC2597) TaxID=252305 RepID=A3U2X4_PSEBH|nr:gephyrin-like molybdotransferase Glp [Pseudooceanicola batsensis]EAQ01504.1 molybdenum cofactor biosynthesis protein A [Pseudooceanicola batsensis HTCC2597]